MFVFGLQVRATSLNELVYKNGQAGVTKATVSITFDNSNKHQSPVGYEHYDEITVTRQVRQFGDLQRDSGLVVLLHCYCIDGQITISQLQNITIRLTCKCYICRICGCLHIYERLQAVRTSLGCQLSEQLSYSLTSFCTYTESLKCLQRCHCHI